MIAQNLAADFRLEAKSDFLPEGLVERFSALESQRGGEQGVVA